MYKAIIEMSDDRADFLSRLFSRPRPAGLDSDAAGRRCSTRSTGGAGDEALFAEEPAGRPRSPGASATGSR